MNTAPRCATVRINYREATLKLRE
jgi:hypothetical protein